MNSKDKVYYTYIVRCADGTYYTGWTLDVPGRVAAHNAGSHGAKYTRTRRPVTLVWQQGFATLHEAMHWEWQIKQWPRQRKVDLIEQQLVLPAAADKGDGRS